MVTELITHFLLFENIQAITFDCRDPVICVLTNNSMICFISIITKCLMLQSKQERDMDFDYKDPLVSVFN